MNKPFPDEPIIHLMVAMPCEAKPLIKRYRLSRQMDEAVFPIYRNASITLTVTGIGKTAMAAGVAYTHAIFGGPNASVWLNIGVSGHPDFPVGQACLAHKITDRDRGKSWYPPLIADPPCCTEWLVTGSRPETAYEQKSLYDMEASGFYETAARFSTSEFVQCFKVVSDNRESPADAFQVNRVSELVENQLELIDILLEQQKQLAAILPEPHSERVEDYIRRWHFSVQQRLQLESLLHRWLLLAPDHCPQPEQLDNLRTGNQVLRYLREKVDHLSLVFP